MARKRMIDPSFWEDPTIGTLSVPARLLFLGMMSHADDEGRLEVEPRYIRRAVFGFDEDITTGLVACYLAEIRELCRSVRFYEVDGRGLAAFINWRRYQYIQKPQASKLPAPPEYAATVPVTDDYDNGIVPLQTNRIERNRIEKNGGEENARVASSPSPSLASVPTNVEARLFTIFENPKQIKKFIAAAVGSRGAFTIADVEVCEQWLSEQNFAGKIGTLNNILAAGQLPKTAAAKEPEQEPVEQITWDDATGMPIVPESVRRRLEADAKKQHIYHR
jgi:hypothetical protein